MTEYEIESPSASALASAPSLPLAIRMLRRLQPVVFWLLASPLHRLLSRDILVLHWVGRRTGRPYRLPLSYVAAGNTLYLCTRPDHSSWWRNLTGGAEVVLLVAGRRRRARAQIVERGSAEAREALGRFFRRNPWTARTLYHVPTSRRRGPSPTHLAAEAPRSVVVRLDPPADGGS